jgi:iron complex outermembrane receptor protein
MSYTHGLRAALLASSAIVAAYASPAWAQSKDFDLPAQPASSGIAAFAEQADIQILVMESDTRGKKTSPVRGSMTPAAGLQQLLAGTGLSVIAGDGRTFTVSANDPQGGSAAGGGAEVEGLIVTAQKREENIQDVPIAMSAFSQEALERSQIAGGPDLITQVPNMSFTKTNFSSYSIQIRGIGTQAISATTDPAVAVAFNNTPFIRNRFFEQEFYDLERLEVLRGPQGTLYGRNATAGVVNIISAKPTFHYDAKASADIGNYSSSRFEGMINIPLVEDKVALRLAGAWTKRDGYALNQMTGQAIDGRDLWSSRLSLRFEPTDWISANLIWEHFEENDDRLRSGKQLCKKHVVNEIGGLPVTSHPGAGGGELGGAFGVGTYTSQGCERVSLFAPEAFETPNGYALPYYGPTGNIGNAVYTNLDPYRSAAQSRDLRVIESSVEPDYRAQTDILELRFDVRLSDALTLTSETAYSADVLFSLQDYNRFTTVSGAFRPYDRPLNSGVLDEAGVFCDPQLGCSDRLLLVDLSTADSTQFGQEFRLSSDFDGAMNFSLGVNFLRHDAVDKYYVFINSLSLFSFVVFNDTITNYTPGVSDNSQCAPQGGVGGTAGYFDPAAIYEVTSCIYVDPNPIGALNDQGRNYFLSTNPYKLISYAAFGEIYYNVTPNLKITGGLRWTVDKKQAPQIPSWLLAGASAGPYPTSQTVDQEWREPTGRLTLDWKPDFNFTDETLIYASYAHGYKAGGANPPPPVFATYAASPTSLGVEPIPDAFGPEFVDAFEIGAKNTLLEGALKLNLTGFYYDYKGYQISEIRNRSAVNSNYDAEVWGLEVEADWRLNEALRLGFKGGYNGTRIGDGQSAIDLMDRANGGRPDENGVSWIVVRPFASIPSNCIIPVDVAIAGDRFNVVTSYYNVGANGACVDAYYNNLDLVTGEPYDPTITDYGALLGPAFADYHGWDPSTAPNGGRGIAKDLSGNELPNAPNFTATVTADYTRPLPGEWLLNLHADVHWQSESWWRIFDDHEYNHLDAFTVVNLAAIFANEDAGWKVMTYIKNVLDEDALTGAFLNSDDTGLTTNVFLTEPRLYGIRVTKDFTGGGWLGGIGRCPATGCALTVELGGGIGRFGGEAEGYAPEWLNIYSPTFPVPEVFDEEDLDWGDMRTIELTYAPTDAWRLSAAYRFGKSNSGGIRNSGYEHVPGSTQQFTAPDFTKYDGYAPSEPNHLRAAAEATEEYTIVDFMVGRSVGFGVLGRGGASTLSAGLRHADLKSTFEVAIDGVPNRVPRADFSSVSPPFDHYTTTLESLRGFEGLGPFAEWDSSLRLLGDEERGHLDLDWTVSGGVLFGTQKTDSEERRYAQHYADFTGVPTLDDSVSYSRSDDVSVPNLSLGLGLSYAIDRVKVSTGYSYERFFDAIDGGIDEAQQYDRTIHGPYLKLSLGFGG